MSGTLLVTIQQAATLVGVSRRTIYNWLRDGKIQFKRTAGGRVRIVSETLYRADEERKAAS